MTTDFRFNHLALSVRDVAASAAFYAEVVGLKEIENKTRNPGIRWLAFDGDREIHLIGGAEAPPPRPIDAHFCLSTPQFEATLAELAGRGVRYCSNRGEPMIYNHRADGVRQAYFQDPDNYWIEVCEADAGGRVG